MIDVPFADRYSIYIQDEWDFGSAATATVGCDHCGRDLLDSPRSFAEAFEAVMEHEKFAHGRPA